MRGRSSLWYRVRVNLIHVPEAERPAQEPLDPDYDPWAGHGHRGLEGGHGRLAGAPPAPKSTATTPAKKPAKAEKAAKAPKTAGAAKTAATVKTAKAAKSAAAAKPKSAKPKAPRPKTPKATS